MRGLAAQGIHPTVVIGDNVSIGERVAIGAYSVVHDNVLIGDDSIIGPHCILGEPLADFYKSPAYANPHLAIGENSLMRSGTILYAGSELGSHFECGHRVTIREHTKIADHVRIGTLSDIQGYCELGRYVRIHSSVHIGQKAKIGDYVWIFPYSVLTNDPHPPSNDLLGVTIDDFAVIAAAAVIMPGIHIGRDALVGARALVSADVPSYAVVVGSPAKQVTTVDQIKSRFNGEAVYPWREHFERDMPWEGVGYEIWRETTERS
jgi:acetyltransferase-like isoleucine patch superfamily enzyme